MAQASNQAIKSGGFASYFFYILCNKSNSLYVEFSKLLQS